MVLSTGPDDAVPTRVEDEALELRWSAPSACFTAEELLAQVGAHPQTRTRRLRIDAEITSVPAGYRLDMSIESAAGEARTEVEHPDCTAVSEAAAVKIALALDPVDVEDEAAIAPQKPAVTSMASTCPAIRSVDPKCPDVEAEAEAIQPRRSVAVGFSTAVDWGTLPGVGPMFEGTVAVVRWPRFRASVSGAYWTGREFWRLEEPGAGGHVSAAGSSVFACFVLRGGGLEFPLCGGAEVTVLSARGIGLSRDSSTRHFRFAVAARPQLVWNPHDRVGLWLASTVAVPVTRARITAGEPATTYRAKRVAARLALGVEVRLGR